MVTEKLASTDIWPNKNFLKKLDSADHLLLARLRCSKNQKHLLQQS